MRPRICPDLAKTTSSSKQISYQEVSHRLQLGASSSPCATSPLKCQALCSGHLVVSDIRSKQALQFPDRILNPPFSSKDWNRTAILSLSCTRERSRVPQRSGASCLRSSTARPSPRL